MNSIERARNVFDIEIEALKIIRDSLDEKFYEVVETIHNCTGKVVVTGMGKSGHIGRKIAATMSSLGTPAFFVHPGEAAHGDLGMVEKDDIILALSNSGETDEVIQLLPSIRKIGAKVISITSNFKSTLSKNSDISIIVKVEKEACMMNIAPTSSTTAVLVYGDALAVCLSELNNFKKEDFGVFHPKGTLGKRLLTKVSNIMHPKDENPIVNLDDSIHDVLVVMSNKAFGLVNVVDDNGFLKGIITAGDLIRNIEKDSSIIAEKAYKIMNSNPTTIQDDLLAVTAIGQIQNSSKKLVVLPVVNKDGMCVGTLSINDLVKEKIL